MTNASGSAEILPAWSPDGRFVSYFSDKSGEYRLYVASQDGITPPREIALPEPSHFYTPSWSPDGKHLVYTDTKLRVWVLDVASGQARLRGRPHAARLAQGMHHSALEDPGSVGEQ